MILRSVNLAVDWLYRARRKLAAAGVGLLACLMAAHVVAGANGMVIYQHKRAEYRVLDKEIEDLKRENDLLTERIKALKTDPETIEREAREQLRYARRGEVVYLLQEPERRQESATAIPQSRP